MEEVQQAQPGTVKVKRVMSDELKAKMSAGRTRRALERREKKVQSTTETPVAPHISIPKRELKIFGDVDRDPRGRIKSEYPASYFSEHTDELRREIDEMERVLENDGIPGAAKPRFKARLAQKRDRLDLIVNGTPKLTGQEVDLVNRVREEIGTQLKDAHPSRSEKEKGTVDAHEEVRRMSEPVMKIENANQAEWAKSCGIRISDNNMVTRNDMDRMFKIASQKLGKSTDIEQLRR
jgi:hypothetical protein